MNWNRAEQITFFLFRVVVGFLFFQAGATKVFGWFGGHAMPLGSQAGIGGLLEFAGGILIMLGLCTRVVAFILSGEMAVAYWQFHAPKGAWPHQNMGTAAVLFCFIFLYLAVAGGGAWSLDSLLRRGRDENLRGAGL